MKETSPHIRSFIAVELNKKIKDTIHDTLQTLQKSDADVKWIPAQNAHLTLKFLGDVALDKIPLIRNTLQNITRQTLPFVISTDVLGAFPSMENPRVIWLGLSRGHDELKNIFEKIEKETAPMGFPKEDRAFNAHITIGRVRSEKNLKSLIKLLKENSFVRAETQEVKSLTLFKSILRSQGAIYQPIEIFSFNKTGFLKF